MPGIGHIKGVYTILIFPVAQRLRLTTLLILRLLLYSNPDYPLAFPESERGAGPVMRPAVTTDYRKKRCVWQQNHPA